MCLLIIFLIILILLFGVVMIAQTLRMGDELENEYDKLEEFVIKEINGDIEKTDFNLDENDKIHSYLTDPFIKLFAGRRYSKAFDVSANCILEDKNLNKELYETKDPVVRRGIIIKKVANREMYHYLIESYLSPRTRRERMLDDKNL